VRARRVDTNQPDIVATFRALGCSVWITSGMGQGAPDLVVSRDGWTVAVEVKDGAKPPSARKLTEDEKTWAANWKGAYAIVETVEQAHQLVADMRLRAALKAC
jgi:Holliday junction resolvase